MISRSSKTIFRMQLILFAIAELLVVSYIFSDTDTLYLTLAEDIRLVPEDNLSVNWPPARATELLVPVVSRQTSAERRPRISRRPRRAKHGPSTDDDMDHRTESYNERDGEDDMRERDTCLGETAGLLSRRGVHDGISIFESAQVRYRAARELLPKASKNNCPSAFFNTVSNCK